jgi:LPXTG-motif cell wall-anchored protein
VDTDEDGGFTVDVPVPADAEPGSFTVVGTDDTTGEAAQAPLTVQLGGGGEECTDPTITADPTSVMAGEDVQITGTGFPRNENVIVRLLDLDGNQIGDSVTVLVDDDCGFTTPITVPEGTPPGVIIVDAQPEDGGEGAQTPIAVVGGHDGGDRELTAWFEHETRTAGQSQTFYASGFDEGETVAGWITSDALVLPNATADADGNVSWTFDVPADFEVGTHVGVATSLEHGDQASAEFQVVASSVSGGGDGDGGGLASTGANVAALIAAMVLLLGAGAVMIKRRREISQAFATAMGRISGDKPAV